MYITEEVKQGIRQEEIDFPRRFASYEERNWGILYYMENNRDSYDGNHACIYPEKIRDLGAVLDEVRDFYEEKGIRASIYHPFVRGYFAENEKLLKAHGFSCHAQEDHRVMLLTQECGIAPGGDLEIRALTTWDERVAADILIPSGEPWEVDVTRRRISRENSWLFVGYLDKKAVVYSDIHLSGHGNTRFDYIVTAKEYRGKGYAGDLLHFIVNYCREHRLPYCWQCAGPSEHICYRAGFREVFAMEAGWAGMEEKMNTKIPTKQVDTMR